VSLFRACLCWRELASCQVRRAACSDAMADQEMVRRRSTVRFR